MKQFLRRTWVEIDLDALTHNFRQIRQAIAPGCKVMSVVKADAYGHSAPRVASVLQELGSEWFAVSNLEEAIQLRNCGIVRPILILGFTPVENAPLLAKYDITQAILSAEYAADLQKSAAQSHVTLRGHLKIDTGMSRIGFFFQEELRDRDNLDAMEAACRLPNVKVEGVFTHFAVADEKAEGEAYTRRQYQNFTRAIQCLEERGIQFSLRHCSNSGAIMDYPEMNLDMVRPGIILYGLWPSGKLAGQMDFRPVMSMKTAVAQVKEIGADTTVSYGRTYTAPDNRRVATLPIGYADGYTRIFSNRAEVLLHGQRAPVVGRVCMDQTIVDVSHIPEVKVGDVVTVFGSDGTETLSVDELCQISQTINYELTCGINKRVPRVILRDGQPIAVEDHLCTEEDLT